MAKPSRELMGFSVVLEDFPFEIIGVKNSNVVEDCGATSAVSDKFASHCSNIEEDSGAGFLAHLIDFLQNMHSLDFFQRRVLLV